MHEMQKYKNSALQLEKIIDVYTSKKRISKVRKRGEILYLDGYIFLWEKKFQGDGYDDPGLIVIDKTELKYKDTSYKRFSTEEFFENYFSLSTVLNEAELKMIYLSTFCSGIPEDRTVIMNISVLEWFINAYNKTE